MKLGVMKKSDFDKMIFRPNDPKSYGYICPVCQKRYGQPSRDIDIQRCSTCPPYHASGVYWYGVKKARLLKKQGLMF